MASVLLTQHLNRLKSLSTGSELIITGEIVRGSDEENRYQMKVLDILRNDTKLALESGQTLPISSGWPAHTRRKLHFIYTENIGKSAIFFGRIHDGRSKTKFGRFWLRNKTIIRNHLITRALLKIYIPSSTKENVDDTLGFEELSPNTKIQLRRLFDEASYIYLAKLNSHNTNVVKLRGGKREYVHGELEVIELIKDYPEPSGAGEKRTFSELVHTRFPAFNAQYIGQTFLVVEQWSNRSGKHEIFQIDRVSSGGTQRVKGDFVYLVREGKQVIHDRSSSDYDLIIFDILRPRLLEFSHRPPVNIIPKVTVRYDYRGYSGGMKYSFMIDELKKRNNFKAQYPKHYWIKASKIPDSNEYDAIMLGLDVSGVISYFRRLESEIGLSTHDGAKN